MSRLARAAALVAGLAAGACGIDANKPSDGRTVPAADGDVIAFASDRNGDFDLFLSNTDGSQIRRLTDNLGFDAEPAWSPDGTRLVFTSERAHEAELYVLDLASLSTRRLTRASGQSVSPSWSPDAADIVYVSDQQGSPDLFVVPAAGGTPRRLTLHEGHDLQPAWSADGARIAYASDRDGGFDLFEVDADGTDATPHRLFASDGADGHPSWSPDGRWLAFVSTVTGSSELYLLPADDLDATPVSLTYLDGADGFRPAWSADARRLAFVAHPGGNPDVYSVFVGAQVRAQLPPSPRLAWSPGGVLAAVLPAGGGALSIVDTSGTASAFVHDAVTDAVLPRWSPSGRRLAFVSTAQGAADVYLHVPTTGEVLNVSSSASTDDQPTWSPGGNRLAFVSDRTGNDDIFVARIGTDSLGSLRVDSLAQASSAPARDWAPRWAPVGDRIAFLSERGGAPAVYVATLDADGGFGALSGPYAADRIGAWSPGGTRLALRSNGGGLLIVSTADSIVYRGTDALVGEPAWGGNEQLVYVSDATGDREVYLLSLAGAGRVLNISQHEADDDQPAWSLQRDGIAFVSDRDGPGDVYAVRLAGGGVFRLTAEHRPVAGLRWLFRGESLFFTGQIDGTQALLKRGGARRVTRNSARDWFPAWSP